MHAAHPSPPLMALPIEDGAIKKLAGAYLIDRFSVLIKAQAGVDAINQSDFARKMVVTVNVLPYFEHLQRKENHALISKTMLFLIRRQAHGPMMQELFGITRHEVTKMRKQCNAPHPSTATNHLSDQERALIYKIWSQVDAQYTDPIDKWLKLAVVDSLAQYPLAAMYSLLIKG